MHNRAAIAMVLGLAACGGSTSQTHATTTTTETAPPPPQPAASSHARGERSVTARIGRMGGSLELANGARLEIDPNVLEGEVEITMSASEGAHVFANEGQTPLGPLVDVQPAFTPSRSGSIHFSVPVARIPEGFPESDLALAVEEEGSQRDLFVSATATRWQMYPARHVGERFSSDLDQLAGHRLQFGVAR